MRIALILFALVFLASMPAHAQVQKLSQDDMVVQVYDPLEPMNRGLFRFSQVVDHLVLQPVAKTYRFVTPRPARTRVRNFFQNLGEPVNFVNAILQGDANQAFTTFWRFVLNSTFGLGGVFDNASQWGLPYRAEDFGQTLGFYGLGSGPFLYIPIIGPSNFRDTTGLVADMFTDPVNYLEDTTVIVVNVADGIQRRESLLDITRDIENTSLDPYAAYRSAFTQKRRDLISNGASR